MFQHDDFVQDIRTEVQSNYLKRSWVRLEHRNRSALLILELCGMREQGVWGVDTITRLSEILSPFSLNFSEKISIFREIFELFQVKLVIVVFEENQSCSVTWGRHHNETF